MRISHFRLSVSCGDAAFDPNAEPELARILRQLADHIAIHGLIGVQGVRDVNGNFVGEVSYTEMIDG